MQPLASSIGASSASVSNLLFFCCIGSRLLLRLRASLFFLPGIALAQQLGQPITAVTGCGGCVALGLFHRPPMLVGAPVGRQQQQQDQNTQRQLQLRYQLFHDTSQSGRSTVFPANACVQSPRN
ncbi:hypothetical protein D3C71_1647660 [compost metagenome]